MKLVKVERKISHKLNLGGFENIEPNLSLTAGIDSGEDLSTALAELSIILEKEWPKIALHEVRMVAKRRGLGSIPDDKVPELMNAFKEIVSS